jgi:bifunctional non-homologous end joining protein LigD
VACRLRPLLEADGLTPVAKTSGSKGLQLYARACGLGSSEQTSAYAKGLAQRLEKEHPDLVVHRMTKSLRPGKVLVDWSQNSAAKTTVSVYSLRARQRPTVSTPVTWDEVDACARPADLVFTSDDVLARVERDGDLFAPLL